LKKVGLLNYLKKKEVTSVSPFNCADFCQRYSSVITDALRGGGKATSYGMEFSFILKELDQVVCIHALGGAGEKASVLTKLVFDGCSQGISSIGFSRINHHMHDFVTMYFIH